MGLFNFFLKALKEETAVSQSGQVIGVGGINQVAGRSKFIARLLSSHYCLDPYHYYGQIVGLGDVINRTQIVPVNYIFRLAVGGYEHDGNVLRALVRFQLATYFVSVNIRQAHVKQQYIHRTFPADLQRFMPRTRGQYFVVIQA
jgi:hypothetical protein